MTGLHFTQIRLYTKPYSRPLHANCSRKDRLKSALIASILAPCLWGAPVLAADVFERSCAGCHVGGGNLVGGRTLKLKDLEADNLLDTDSLYEVIANGKKRMPGFGETCTPRGQCTFGPRLSEEELRSLSEFVLEQAKNGWK